MSSSDESRLPKGRVVVYSIVGCPHCLKAKSTLQEKKLTFTDVSVDRFPPYVREWLRKRTGKSSVPQIFFNEKLIGGNMELQKLILNEDKFQEALKDLYENDPPPEGPDAPVLPHPSEAVDIPSIDGEKFSCEPDEFAEMVAEMKRAGFVKQHRTGLFCGKGIKDSFTGKEFCDWAVDKKMMTRERAVFMGRQLVSRRFAINVDEEKLEFRDDASALYKLSTSDAQKALNASQMSECVQRPAGEVAEDMRKLILKLFSDFLSPDGKYVDYKGIGASKSFQAYKRMTLELQRVDLDKLSREEKLAFFINIYNALVIHGTVEKGTPSNLWQRYKFFSSVAYNLGGHVFSLNDIENGVLRANKASMGTLYVTPFGKHDPRLKQALPEVEPRIHFALNCGAKSCPPIKTFSAKEIDNQLDVATESFLEDDDALRVNAGASEVHLSMIFKWYFSDFGRETEDMLKWLQAHLPEGSEKKQLLGEKKYKIKYIPYDWGHNEKK